MGWAATLALLFLLLLLLLVAVFGAKRYNFCEPRSVGWLRRIPIAHRGLHTREFDENSIGAFSNAIAHGFGIELDVRLTKDGVPVIMHDATLDRLFGVDRPVSQMILAEMKELRFRKSGETIPTLAETMAHVSGRAPVLIEIKNFGWPGRLESAMVDVLEGYEGDYAFHSFGPLACGWMRTHSDRAVALLLDDFPLMRCRFLRNLKDNLFAAICRPGLISYHFGIMTPEIARGYRASNVTVLGWVLYEDALVDRSYRRYVDNIIFEYWADKT